MTVPPHDIEAEESILGAMMISYIAVDSVIESLVASEFYRPAHQTVYATMSELYGSGVKIDAVTVGNALKNSEALQDIGGPPGLIRLMADAVSTSGVRHYAEIVSGHALRRRMMGEGQELINQAQDLSLNVMDALDAHRATMESLGTTIIDHEPDDVAIEDFMNRPKDLISPWVIYGIIRRRHKLMLVGGEGGGKSWLLRFIAICAAYGIEPFRQKVCQPVRTLVVDLENPEDALYDSFELILKKVTTFNPQSETVNRLWWRPQGMNLRNRVDLAAFENVIRVRRPDLVCLGPLYAAYENSSKDFGWETAAREVQTILKRLMVRYDFALMIEDHAPQGDGIGKREMRPYGSSFWRRWPDIGIGMEPLGSGDTLRDDAFRLTRWRGDRVPTDWPKVIERGSATKSPWPFIGRWEENDVQF